MSYKVKDSGKRQSFETGMVRDIQDNKPRPDLISPFMLIRVGEHMRKGAVKYAERNWEKGQPFSRAIASTFRHLLQFIMGDKEEDHLSAIIFNIMCIIHYQEMIKIGILPKELDDMPVYRKEAA